MRSRPAVTTLRSVRIFSTARSSKHPIVFNNFVRAEAARGCAEEVVRGGFAHRRGHGCAQRLCAQPWVLQHGCARRSCAKVVRAGRARKAAPGRLLKHRPWAGDEQFHEADGPHLIRTTRVGPNHGEACIPTLHAMQRLRAAYLSTRLCSDAPGVAGSQVGPLTSVKTSVAELYCCLDPLGGASAPFRQPGPSTVAHVWPPVNVVGSS